MKVFVEVTNLLSISFLTGIQRVVIEVISRLANDPRLQIVPIAYSFATNKFQKFEMATLSEIVAHGRGDADVCDGVDLPLDEIGPGTVFFDIDSAWNAPYRRSALYPAIKANGAKIAVYVYDIIPVTYPQYCHGNTIVKFGHYIGATLGYADRIIVSTQHTLDEIADLCAELGIPEVPGSVSWLGADFKAKATGKGEIAKVAEKAAAAGKFALMVGTVEPRKNHAAVIDAFESSLFDKGYNLVIVGRIGWNSEEIEKRIRTHRLLGKQLFFLEKMNDATVDFLYRQATCVAFATFEEGFGLPIIEAFQRGTPVIASDIPVLREVGGDCCTYFDPKSPESIAAKFLELASNDAVREEKKSAIASYKHVTWDEVAASVGDALGGMETEFPYPPVEKVKQIVYLTARADDLLATLPFIEHFMPFIEEMVLCCPDAMEAEVRQKYHGRLKAKFLTDSMLLAGDKLPHDHAMRNFFLRCRILRREEIDPVFIMSDDDYRPIVQISPADFYEGGAYKGYFCYELKDWRGDERRPSSFDECMFRTRDFLARNGLPSKMYESHMPQVIDRRVFCEMLDRFDGIESVGLSEWSTYFNYLAFRYPSRARNLPCATLTWPGRPNMWQMQVEPPRYLFENFYAESYEENGLFAGMDPAFHEGIENDSPLKVACFTREIAEDKVAHAMFNAYRDNYEATHGEPPRFEITFDGGTCQIEMPEYLALCERECSRIPFIIHAVDPAKKTFEIGYSVRLIGDEAERYLRYATVDVTRSDFNLLVRPGERATWRSLEVAVKYNGESYSKFTKLRVMAKSQAGLQSK